MVQIACQPTGFETGHVKRTKGEKSKAELCVQGVREASARGKRTERKPQHL